MFGITAIKIIPFGKFYDVPSFQITLAFTPGSDVVYPSGIKTLARTREYLQHEFSIDLLETVFETGRAGPALTSSGPALRL